MDAQISGSDQRLSELEAQIERLTRALQEWRGTESHVHPLEDRLTALTEQCADILKQWSATGDRHAQAVGELEARLTGWNDVEARLQRDATWRFQALERVIEQEWASLRHLHEEPTRQLRAHAESLAEISASTAGSAQNGLERAEARLAMIERDLHRRIDELSHEVKTVATGLRLREGGAAAGRLGTPWSFDEVTRLHHEIRGADTQDPAVEAAGEDPNARAASVSDNELAKQRRAFLAGPPTDNASAPRSRGAIDDSGTPERRGMTDRRMDSTTPSRQWYVAVGALAVSLVFSAILAALFYRQADTAAVRASQATQHAEEIAAAANRRIEAAQEDAATKIKQASDAAVKAQVTSEVLAAPDLVRFNLSGGDTGGRYSGQLLWSRSRGMVFSASRLPAPSPGTTYQVWLLTGENPVSVGTFIPDPAGRVSAATEDLPSVPRPVTGASVTLEPTPGRDTPTGTIVLARAQ